MKVNGFTIDDRIVVVFVMIVTTIVLSYSGDYMLRWLTGV